MVLRTVFLPKAMDEHLRKLAFHQGKSKSQLIREVLEKWLRESRKA